MKKLILQFVIFSSLIVGSISASNIHNDSNKSLLVLGGKAPLSQFGRMVEKTKQASRAIARKVKNFVSHRYTDQAITGFCISFLAGRVVHEVVKEIKIENKIKEAFPDHLEITYRKLYFLKPIALALQDKNIKGARNKVDELYVRSPQTIEWMLERQPRLFPDPRFLISVPVSLCFHYDYPIVRFLASVYFDKNINTVSEQETDYIATMLSRAPGRVNPIASPVAGLRVGSMTQEQEALMRAEQEEFNVRRFQAAMGHSQRGGSREPEGIAQLPLDMQRKIFQHVMGRELKPTLTLPKAIETSLFTKGLTTFCVGWLGAKAVRNIQSYQNILKICKKYFGAEFKPFASYLTIMGGNFYKEFNEYNQIIYLANQYSRGGFNSLIKAYENGKAYLYATKLLLRTKKFARVLAELHYKREPSEKEFEKFLNMFEQKTNLFYPKNRK